MSPMRIAFLTNEFVRRDQPAGGLANYLAKITRLLKDRGHEPEVFLLGDENRREEVDGILVQEVRNPCRNQGLVRRLLGTYYKTVEQWLESRSLAKALLARHRRAPFSIVQAPSVRGLGSAAVGRVFPPLTVRVSSHTPRRRAADQRTKTLADHIGDWQEISTMIRAQGVFAPSYSVARTLKRIEGIRVEVIRTPFIMPQVEEDPSLYRKTLKGKSFIAYFGKLNRIKGWDVISDAIPSLFQAHPDLHVVFIGGGEGRVENGLTRREYALRQAGDKAAQVHVLGELSKSAAFPILREARMILIPSRIDNYPNTCLEAQALGKIVVGTRDSSLDEMVEDGVTGFLAEPGDSESLASAILRGLALSAEERKQMAERIQLLEKQRDPEECLQRLERFYRSVAHAGPGYWRNSEV